MVSTRHRRVVQLVSVAGAAALLGACGGSSPSVDATATSTVAGASAPGSVVGRAGSSVPGTTSPDPSAPGTTTPAPGTDTDSTLAGAATIPGAPSTTAPGAATVTTVAGGGGDPATTIPGGSTGPGGNGNGGGVTTTARAGQPATTTATTAAPATTTPTTVAPVTTSTTPPTTQPLPTVTAEANGGTEIHCMGGSTAVSATIKFSSTGATKVEYQNTGGALTPVADYPKLSGNLNVQFPCAGPSNPTTTLIATGPTGTSAPKIITWTIHHM